MTALAKDRNTVEITGELFQGPVAATTVIYKGALIARDSSGNLVPITATTGLIGMGRSEQNVDNDPTVTGATCDYRAGIFIWGNGDTITKSHIGETAYGFDDQTVKRVGTGLSPVGIIVDVTSDGVAVDTKPGSVLGSAGLLAANNLSDVGTVATARGNLGLDTGDSPTFSSVTITNNAVISGATDATTTTTGSLKTAGGLGVAKALFADSVTSSKKIVSVGASQGVGYAIGAGGAVTQITNRSTAVTMVPNPCMSGTITTDTTSLAAGASAEFTVTNSGCAIGDVVVVSIRSGSSNVAGVAGTTSVTVVAVTAGTFIISVCNNSTTTAETGAIIINFAIIKAVAS